MNRTLVVAGAVMLALALGILLGRFTAQDEEGSGPAAASGEREVLYWVAPMDPSYRRDGPGKSPMGMDLVPVYADEAGAAEPGGVSISPTVVNSLGVRTAPVERGALSRRVETVGYVGYDEDTLQHIHTRVDGWIETLVTSTF